MSERLQQFELPTHVMKPGGVIPYYSNALFYDDGQSNGEFNLDRNKSRDALRFKPPETPVEMLDTLGMRKVGQVFNTAETKKAFQETCDSSAASGERVNVITIVCPPYRKNNLDDRENIGLAADFAQEPLAYNFAFDYRVIAFDLAYTAATMEKFGVPVKPTLVVGDWGYRGVEGVRQTLPTDEAIQTTMDRFTESAETYLATTYPQMEIAVDRFSNTQLKEIFPIGMPNRPGDKKIYMREQIQNAGNVQPCLKEWLPVMSRLDDLYQVRGDGIFELASPNVWSTIEREVPEFFEDSPMRDPSQSKKFLVDFMKLFGNAVASRNSEITHLNGVSVVEASYYDAMMKAYEYVAYGQVFSGRYKNAVNFNWDTKFPAAGLFYQAGSLDTIFLDPNRFPTPLRQLGVKVIPF